MFSEFPTVFKNEKSANNVANAFSNETKEHWVVLVKQDNNQKYFKPCKSKDYTNEVKRNGWFIAT
jgi:hypothetical protein